MSTPHTPLPWTIRMPTNKEVSDFVRRHPCVIAADGCTVASMAQTRERSAGEKIANAALIVRAVNHHYQLTAALEQAVDRLERSDPPEGGATAQDISDFRALLAKIESEHTKEGA